MLLEQQTETYSHMTQRNLSQTLRVAVTKMFQKTHYRVDIFIGQDYT